MPHRPERLRKVHAAENADAADPPAEGQHLSGRPETGTHPGTGACPLQRGRPDRKTYAGTDDLRGTGRHGALSLYRPSRYGQRQRVLLARAICQQPKLLLLDEPTSFLDIRHKLEFLLLLRKLAETQDIAVVLSLHELDLAKKIPDRILCLKNGRVDREGTPEEIFRDDYIRRLFDVEEKTYIAVYGEAGAPF